MARTHAGPAKLHKPSTSRDSDGAKGEWARAASASILGRMSRPLAIQLDPELRRTREATVWRHIEAEQRGDWAEALATFARPRYEVTPTGETFDGRDAVAAFYAENHRAFADLQFETVGLYTADELVIHEAIFEATHAGPWRGLPATGRRLRYPMLNVFVFEGPDLVSERMYFDALTPLRQVGLAHDPLSLGGKIATVINHPMTVMRALVRSVGRRPTH